MSDDTSKKWRCAWCDKPHERDDPPCDNCGHHKFERAVVPVAPEDPDYERDPIWVCPECGRQHQKNSPPCSRCGHTTLEKEAPDYEDYDDLGVPTYRELIEPRYIAGFAAAVVAGAILLLGVAGIGPLAGVGGPSLTVENVPGQAESASGLSLAEIETAYLSAINEQRQATGAGPVERVDRLDGVAQFYNQRKVKKIYGNGTLPSDDRLTRAIGDACSGTLLLDDFVFRSTSDGEPASLSTFETETEAGTAIADSASQRVSAVEGSRTGIDIHVGPDGTVYVTQFICQ